MTLQNFISRLNWRQILIHFIAAWFFMYSFQTLAFLHNTKLLDIVRQSNKETMMRVLAKNGTSPSDLMNFNLWAAFGHTIGLLIAFIISLIISTKKHWFWVNSAIVLIVAYLLGLFDLLGWTFLKNIFLTPGLIFRNTTLEFLSNGVILLSLGLLVFFSRRTNQFISKHHLLAALEN